MIANEHAELDKAKESVYILQRGLLNAARKYAQIFRKANSSPRAKFEENCELQGTDNVQGQILEHIFKSKRGCCIYYPSNINITRIFSSFSWDIFSHVTRLDQSCASENI